MEKSMENQTLAKSVLLCLDYVTWQGAYLGPDVEEGATWTILLHAL